MRGEAVEDIEWGPLSIEHKTRKRPIPDYLHDWMAQAETNSGTRIPVVVWHQDGMHLGKEFVIMTLRDFVNVLLYLDILSKEGAAYVDEDTNQGLETSD